MFRDRIQGIELSIRKISDKAAEQENCVRLDIGQPSFDTPEHVKEAAKKGLEQKQGYTSTLGIDELRSAIAEEERMKDGIGDEIGSENVMVTTGGMGAVFSVFASILGPSDTATFNDPCWGPYKLISEVNGNNWGQVSYWAEDGSLREDAKDLIKNSELAVVNTPANPTGTVLSRYQAREIGEFCEQNDTFLVSDEVYHRLTYGRQHHSPAAHASRSAIIGSISKNHAMTGFRVGWIAGKEDHVQEFAKVSRATTACPPKISQIAAVDALEKDSHVEKMRQEYEERRDLVARRMEELGWEFKLPEGAIYAFPDVKRDSWSFCMEMIEKGVAMVPGEPFGPESDTNVRISFGSSTKEEINRAFDILEEEL